MTGRASIGSMHTSTPVRSTAVHRPSVHGTSVHGTSVHATAHGPQGRARRGRPDHRHGDRLLPCPRASASGWSLVELTVALAILALLLGLGAPAYSQWLAETRVANLAHALADAIDRARSEAIKHGGRATLCKSADRRGCTTAGGWEAGWLLFLDDDADGAPDADEIVVGAEPAAASRPHGAGEPAPCQLRVLHRLRPRPAAEWCATDGHVHGMPQRSARLSRRARQFGTRARRPDHGPLSLSDRARAARRAVPLRGMLLRQFVHRPFLPRHHWSGTLCGTRNPTRTIAADNEEPQ